MLTVATDPANSALITEVSGSYMDANGVARDITLHFTYPENGDSSQKLPLTKREIMAMTIFSTLISSPSFENTPEDELAYKAVKDADMLISTLNSVTIP